MVPPSSLVLRFSILEKDSIPRVAPSGAQARAAGVPTPGGGASTLGLLGDRTRRFAFSRFHHFQSRIEFMAAGHAAYTV